MSENLKNGDFALIIHLEGCFFPIWESCKPFKFSVDQYFFHFMESNIFTILFRICILCLHDINIIGCLDQCGELLEDIGTFCLPFQDLYNAEWLGLNKNQFGIEINRHLPFHLKLLGLLPHFCYLFWKDASLSFWCWRLAHD